ncbi:putative outer-membrane protein, putative secreted protein [Devosia sp. LC5]|uniref:outer membrane protein n=1 Tax=Devosia sp. LC5 TaxID=1502724 RepID=UPI0004E3DEDD|nr:outer membrane beta-barrel protein [Devosia sp. LC5]KFC72486.1 putative outer-membrane protein, putative secreted protein [Devosia sp. LC5]
MFVRSLSLGVAAAALLVGGAQAADLIIPTTPAPIYEAAGFSWDGMYAGVQGGGEFFDGFTNGVIGAHVGVNFIVADPILLGVEGTAEYVFGDETDGYGEFFINGRVGAVVTDSVLVYALAGAGVAAQDGSDNVGLYQLGGGVELAVTDAVSVRGQIVGVGTFDDGDDFFEAAKATIGVSYHF